MEDMADEIEIDVEPNADGSEIKLTMRSLNGAKISTNDYVMELELYLNELVRAQTQRLVCGFPCH